MFKYILADKNGIPVDVHKGLDDDPVLIVESLRTLECHWKTGLNDAVETTTIVEAKPNQAIMLIDIIITSSKKVTDATIIPVFDDGTNSVDLFTIEGGLAAVEFSHSFVGGIRGWKNADFKITTNKAAINVETFIGYIHLSEIATKTYSVWNAER